MIRDAQNQYDKSKKNVQELLQDMRDQNATNDVKSATVFKLKKVLVEKPVHKRYGNL